MVVAKRTIYKASYGACGAKGAVFIYVVADSLDDAIIIGRAREDRVRRLTGVKEYEEVYVDMSP